MKPKSVGRPRKYPIKDISVKYTRRESVYDSIKLLCRNGSDAATIMYHSNKLYMRHGGSTIFDERVLNRIVNTTLEVLIEFNIIYKEVDIYRFYSEELEISRS